MKVSEVMRAWGQILQGRPPALSIEVTKECPLRCPGCYAFDDHHLGGGTTLRQLTDKKGEALVEAILATVERERPLHLSLVGGDPLVRYREMETVIPQVVARGVHVQLVTSAFRTIPAEWAKIRQVNVVVSIDGLQPEHDVRRAPATYDRILKNIAGGRITVHCTITGQMMKQPGYLNRFVDFWAERPEVRRIWFSIFTPQIGDTLPEILTPEERRRAVVEIGEIARKQPKLEMPPGMIREYLDPPKSPEDCIFARTTKTISADFRTEITPCQFGGNPDCSNCGCIASAGLKAIGDYRLGGVIRVGAIFRGSIAIGDFFRRRRAGAAPEADSDLVSISPAPEPKRASGR